MLRSGVTAACRLTVVGTGALLIGRQVGANTEIGVSAIAALPIVTLAALAAEAVLALLRDRLSALVGAVVVICACAAQLPSYVPSPHSAAATTITVMTSNLRLGLAEPEAVVQMAYDNQVDVLALQELTEHAAVGLAQAGLNSLMPYHFLAPRAAGAGVGLWSRHPLTNQGVLEGFGFPPVAAEITVDGRQLTVISFHSKAPLYNGGTAPWEADLRSLSAVIAATPGSKIVAGDFNATYDHRQFRDLLSDGYTDAARDAGAGWLPTFPADGTIGPIAAIDHVVLGAGLVGTRVHSAPVRGSDHRAIIAEVALPPATG
jgi:endonuclease/exonuclease/phosphatase (EEP) superfamily protein YafD